MILHASQDTAVDANATLKTIATTDSRRSVVKVTCARSSGGLILEDKHTRVVLDGQGGHPVSARGLPFVVAMTVRILVARSATESLRDFVAAAVQAATVASYGLLLAVLWMLLAGRLY
jgi:hypothetical protein